MDSSDRRQRGELCTAAERALRETLGPGQVSQESLAVAGLQLRGVREFQQSFSLLSFFFSVLLPFSSQYKKERKENFQYAYLSPGSTGCAALRKSRERGRKLFPSSFLAPGL